MKPIFPLLRRFAFFSSGLLSLALTSQAEAAPLVISDVTYSGSVTAGTPEAITGNATVTGLTTSEGTATSLIGATANNVVTTNTLSSIGTVPASANAAVSGLSANDGVNNLQSGNFQFSLGSSFTIDTRFFIIESTPQSSTAGDPTEVRFIDASNNVIGSFLLSLTAANFTNTPANTTNTSLATLTYTTGQGTLTAKLGGVVFSAADLGVTDFSAIANATGIRLVSPGAVGGANILDPNVVGIYAVPEPGTVALVGAGLGACLIFRRRSAAR